MIQEYTKDMFEKDKKEMLAWLSDNWTYEDEWSTYLSDILLNLKNWINNMKAKKLNESQSE